MNAKTLIEWTDSPVGVIGQEMDEQLTALIARLNQDNPVEGGRTLKPAMTCPGEYHCWSIMTYIPPEGYAGHVHIALACQYQGRGGNYNPWFEVTARVSEPSRDDVTWLDVYHWESSDKDMAMTLVHTLEKVETFLTQIEAGYRGPK